MAICDYVTYFIFKREICVKKISSRVALLGIMGALALTLAFLENLLPPIPFFPPGAKLGLSNVILMFVAASMGFPSAFSVMLVKSGFVFITRGMTAFWMSFAGGVASVIIMSMAIKLPKKNNGFSISLISVLSAVAHNAGQIVAASFLLGSNLFLSYGPFLLIFGVIAGLITGIVLKIFIPLLTRLEKKVLF